MTAARTIDITPYEPRPVRFLGLWEVADWRLKVYGIAYGRALPRVELVDASRAVVARHLAAHPTRQAHYGVGFVGIHDGRGENQVFIDRWVNSNELLHEYYVSPPDDPAALRAPPADHNSVCVWDLGVQWVEREAWIRHVIGRAGGGDVEGYMRDRFEGEL
jgi:hypothetical protein